MPPAATRRHAAACRFRHLFWCSGPQQILVDIALEGEMGVVKTGTGEVVVSPEAEHVGTRGSHQIEIRSLLDEENTRGTDHGGKQVAVKRQRPAQVLVP